MKLSRCKLTKMVPFGSKLGLCKVGIVESDVGIIIPKGVNH